MLGTYFVKLFAIATFTSCSLVKFIDRRYIEFRMNRPEYRRLRMSTGITYVECEGSAERLSKIRELLHDATKDHWVILVGDSECVKLDQVGTIYKNTRGGTAFEGRRNGVSEDTEFEVSHICRTPECKFSAAQSRNSDYLGSNQQVRSTLHIRNFAFADKTAAVSPVVDIPGPRQVAAVYAAPKKVVCGVISLALVLILRIRKAWASLDVQQSLGNSVRYVIHVVLVNVISLFSAFDGGVMGGLTQFVWGDHPPWALWVAGRVVYGGPAWYFNIHTKALGNSRLSGRLNQVTAAHRRPSSVSEPPSDAEDKSCQPNSLYMALPITITALSRPPCLDSDCEPTPILREDHAASRLPPEALGEGLCLCRTNRDIYNTLRDQQVCSVLQCLRLGVAGPDGKHYCASHMGQAVVPPADAPKVKVETDPRHPKAPSVGMDNIPDSVLRALAHRMSADADLSEHEIASKLTDDYGGDLLSNALRVYRLLCDRSSSPNRYDMDDDHPRDSHAPTQKSHPEAEVRGES